MKWLIIVIWAILFWYLMCVALTSLMFWGLEMWGVDIDFSIWIWGGIFYILWTLFWNSR